MATRTQPNRLNDAQMVLLQLFQHRVMTADELNALRDTLVLHLTKELDEEIAQSMKTKGITLDDVSANVHALNQNRTQHKDRMRVKV